MTQQLQWLKNLELETDYLVSKHYGWGEVREMESWRRRSYCEINLDKDKAKNKAIKQAAGGPLSIADF